MSIWEALEELLFFLVFYKIHNIYKFTNWTHLLSCGEPDCAANFIMPLLSDLSSLIPTLLLPSGALYSRLCFYLTLTFFVLGFFHWAKWPPFSSMLLHMSRFYSLMAEEYFTVCITFCNPFIQQWTYPLNEEVYLFFEQHVMTLPICKKK